MGAKDCKSQRKMIPLRAGEFLFQSIPSVLEPRAFLCCVNQSKLHNKQWHQFRSLCIWQGDLGVSNLEFFSLSLSLSNTLHTAMRKKSKHFILRQTNFSISFHDKGTGKAFSFHLGADFCKLYSMSYLVEKKMRMKPRNLENMIEPIWPRHRF